MGGLMKNILSDIQTRLRAPKGQFNSFGKYSYRSCEDILTAVKPLLEEHQAHIILSDEIVFIGNWHYVQATAALCKARDDKEDLVIGTSIAYARESENKKGMDSSQITGSTSSYARKYALNGLLCIDDTKDADYGQNENDEPQKTSQNPKSSPDKPNQPRPISEAQRKKMYAMAKAKESLSDDEVIKFLGFLKGKGEIITVSGEETITMKSASDIFDNFDKYFDEFTGGAFGDSKDLETPWD